MKIFKFPIATLDDTDVLMHRGAKLLDVQAQHGVACVWALCDEKAPLVRRLFYVFGTGHDATNTAGASYVGTYQLHGGELVFHLFDRGELEVKT